MQFECRHGSTPIPTTSRVELRSFFPLNPDAFDVSVFEDVKDVLHPCVECLDGFSFEVFDPGALGFEFLLNLFSLRLELLQFVIQLVNLHEVVLDVGKFLFELTPLVLEFAEALVGIEEFGVSKFLGLTNPVFLSFDFVPEFVNLAFDRLYLTLPSFYI